MPNYNISSTSTSHYTLALPQGEAESEDFPGLRGDGNGEISQVSVRSAEALDWQIEVWDNDSHIINSHAFVAANDAEEVIIGSTTYYEYTVSDLNWSIPLTVPKATVTIAVRNNSSAAKSADTAGAITVTLNIRK